jgi:hypothetical protein
MDPYREGSLFMSTGLQGILTGLDGGNFDTDWGHSGAKTPRYLAWGFFLSGEVGAAY